MRVIVLGGGVVGVTAAYQLQRDGHEVVVVERNREIAAGASWGNAGMIAPGHSFVWSSPRAPIILAKSLLLKDQALRFKLSGDPRLYAWTWGFIKECTAAKARRNTLLKHVSLPIRRPCWTASSPTRRSITIAVFAASSICTAAKRRWTPASST
jgi:D-amino-acid dehydrogenase